MTAFFASASPAALARAAGRIGTNRFDYVEIDILLTHLLQRLSEAGLMEHLVFKGGTMLRKMVFGQNGRLSTDLDFTVRDPAAIERDDLVLAIASAFGADYRSIQFGFNLDRDLGVTETTCRANPRCRTVHTPGGHVIKIEVSYRAEPILPPVDMPQLGQSYFGDLDFEPSAIPCLRLEEAIGEKVRAAFQRPKIRDLHDLQQLRHHGFDHELARRMAVLKLWEAPEGGSFEPFSHETFARRMRERVQQGQYEEADLQGLLRGRVRVDLPTMIREVEESYAFLRNLTEAESALCADRHKRDVGPYEASRAAIRAEHAPVSVEAEPDAPGP